MDLLGSVGEKGGRNDDSRQICDPAHYGLAAELFLVALTLLIAESRPDEKETVVKVVVNLINLKND